MRTPTRRVFSIDMSTCGAMCDEYICVERDTVFPDVEGRCILEGPVAVFWRLGRAVDFQRAAVYAQRCGGVFEIDDAAPIELGGGGLGEVDVVVSGDDDFVAVGKAIQPGDLCLKFWQGAVDGQVAGVDKDVTIWEARLRVVRIGCAHDSDGWRV
jgi:hypothetical protein